MIGFFIKKAFFDGWDNLIGMVVLNLGFLAILLGGIYSMTLLGESAGLAMVLIIIALGLFSFYSAGSAHLTWGWAAYERGGWAAFVRGLRISWRHALLFWLLLALDGSLLLFVIPFYLSYGTIVGTLLSVVLFWLFIALSLALLYYWPLFYSMQGDGPAKTLRKSFVIVADNLFFSLFFAFHQIVTFVISIILAGLAPGMGGILLGQSVALKLLMYKYDWLEEHPDEDRKKVPWDELLWEERESVGHRSLKNMIFPWKD